MSRLKMVLLSCVLLTTAACVPSSHSDHLNQAHTTTNSPLGSGDVNPPFVLTPHIVKEAELSVATDPYQSRIVGMSGELLQMDVSYSGGCETHRFEPRWSGKFTASGTAAPVVHLVVTHDANRDSCEAIISENVIIDLTPIKTLFFEQNPDASAGELQVRLEGVPEPVMYRF